MDWMGSFLEKTWISMMFCTPSGSSTTLWMDPLSAKKDGTTPVKEAERKGEERGLRPQGGREGREPALGPQPPLWQTRPVLQSQTRLYS